MFSRIASRRLATLRPKQPQPQQRRTFFGIPDAGVRGEALVQFEKDKVSHAQKTAELWKKLFLFSGIPILLVSTAATIKMETDHAHHMKEHPYHYKDLPYLHIRNKNFPWKDGNKSLFYNPETQPLE